MLKKLRIHETLRVQGNDSPQDAVGLGDKCIGITIRCLQTSPAPIYVGWNEKASAKNVLQPGDSITYGNIEGTVLDDNDLYIGYGGDNARALISILNDTGKTCDD